MAQHGAPPSVGGGLQRFYALWGVVLDSGGSLEDGLGEEGNPRVALPFPPGLMRDGEG